MGLLMRIRRDRAVKRIAKRLPPFLVGGYGSSADYSAGQVERGMQETGCNASFIDYAYAMFCDAATFDECSSGDYEAIRTEIGEICLNGKVDFNATDMGGHCSGVDGAGGGVIMGGGDGAGGSP